MLINTKKSLIFQSLAVFSLLACLTACGGGKNAGGPSTQAHNPNDDVATANSYQRTLAANPDDTSTRLALGELFETHGDNANAAAQYEILIQKDANDGEAHRDLGRVLIKQGKASDAKAEYEKALSINGDDTKAMNGLGIALDYLGNHGAAQKVYKEALDENSNDLAALNNLAHSYVLSGSYNEAIALLEPHLNDKAATPALRQNLAEAYGMAGMPVDAERVGKIDLTPDQIKHNLAYYSARREQLSVAPKFYADLGSFPTEAMAEARVEQIKAIFPKETSTLVINVTPEVKSIGGTPAFSVRALGFTNASKVHVFCDKLKKQDIACMAHG